MPIYKVLDGHILHDGKLYAPGDTIDLSGDQAEKLNVSALPGNEQDRANLTNRELTVILEQRGVEIPSKATKAQLLDLLAESEATGKKDGE
jgi:hypothetical protein